MTTGQSERSKVWVLENDSARNATLCEQLRYLEYEPIVVDKSTDRNLVSECIALLVGGLDAQADVRGAAEAIRCENPDLPIIHLSDTPGLEAGPSWNLSKPSRSPLKRLLQRAERYTGTERRQRITGQSHPIRQVRKLIEQVSDFDTNVLVTGQSGTGKELVARTIHELSARSNKPFVPINCGAIPAELLESELFGHEKGSFTGAVSARKGRFELAEGGTLFLDEIGDMSMDMQVKLLRVLQERVFERVGSNRQQVCDVRIIAATHVDLPEAIREGRFREDLFYRLNVFPIEMPPLYRRVSDIPMLVDELLHSKTSVDSGQPRLSPAALDALKKYRWPGNIRELANLVERLAIVKPQGVIDIGDIPSRYLENASPDDAEAAGPAEPTPAVPAAPPGQFDLKEHLQMVEQSLIGQALEATDGVVAKAARLLSMQRTTLVEKIGKYQLAS